MSADAPPSASFDDPGRHDARTPVHRRSLIYDAYDDGDQLHVAGRIFDERPWDDDTEVHDLRLHVSISMSDLVIVDARAEMVVFPHAECPDIERTFDQLVGVSVGRGFTSKVTKLFVGVAGCTHLDQLARGLGPAVIQSMPSVRKRNGVSSIPGSSPWMKNTCHIWGEGGIGEQKVQLGWRVGVGGRPAPTVAEIRQMDLGEDDR